MNSLVESIVKAAIYEAAKRAIMKAIIAKVPFLGSWFFNPIVSFVITKILDIVYEHVYRAVSFGLIDLRTEIEREAYDNAVRQIEEVLNKEESTEEDIEKAKDRFRKSFDDLVRFPGGLD